MNIDEEDIQHVRQLGPKIKKLREKLQLDSSDRTPQPGENLREFFVRTKEYWLLEAASGRNESKRDQVLGKELRKIAFQHAEDRFQELFPILQQLNALEEEQRIAEEAAAAESNARAAAARKRSEVAKTSKSKKR